MAGATTQAERQAQVLAAGYSGPMTDAAINQAYANAATPSDLASSGISNKPQSGAGPSPSPSPNPALQGNYANLTAQNQLMQQAQQAAYQAYLNARLNLDTDDLAFRKATEAFNETVTKAGVTGTYEGAPTQAALQFYANTFGTWGTPQQGQQTLAAQNQAATQAQNVANLTGWYTPPSYSPVPPITSPAGVPSGLTWDQLSNQMRAQAGASYNDAAKQLAFSFQGNQAGNLPMNLSPDQLNQVISMGTGGQFGNYGLLSGQPLSYPAGTVVRTAGNQFGVVGADGRVTPGDASNPAIYQAIQANQGIMTVPDAQFAAASQPVGQPSAANTGQPGQAPVQTLAGNEQAYTQWLRSQQQALAQWQAQQQGAQAYLNMMSQLRGPADWIQYQKVLGATPGGLQDLARAAAGQYIPGVGTTGVQPQAVSMAGFVNSATGGQPSANQYQYGGEQAQQTQAFQNSLVAPNQMAPQTWNALTPSQQQMLLGTWEGQGYTQEDAKQLFTQSLPKYATGAQGAGSFRLQ